MPFKYEADGSIALAEHNGVKLPVFVNAEGKEAPFDADSTVLTIQRLNGEAKGHRTRAEAAETSLKSFEGLDPAAARKAIETVTNLDHKKLVDVGEVERVKADISKTFQTQIDAANEKAKKLEADLYGEKVGGSFARSKFVTEKLAIPADMVQARFGSAFKVREDGKVVAVDAQGHEVLSRTRAGEVADFDEALAIMVDSYPSKDFILKGSGASGSGANGTTFAQQGAKSISRAQLEGMPPAERAAAAKGKTVTD